VQAKDFIKQIILGKMVTKFRFQVYDVTDPDSPSDVAIWEQQLAETQLQPIMISALVR